MNFPENKISLFANFLVENSFPVYFWTSGLLVTGVSLKSIGTSWGLLQLVERMAGSPQGVWRVLLDGRYEFVFLNEEDSPVGIWKTGVWSIVQQQPVLRIQRWCKRHTIKTENEAKEKSETTHKFKAIDKLKYVRGKTNRSHGRQQKLSCITLVQISRKLLSWS